jgi:hypothetical protein
MGGLFNPGAILKVAETQVYNAAAPIIWTDLDLSSVVGAQVALVIIKVINITTNLRTLAVRKNGDTDDFYEGSASYGCAESDIKTSTHVVFLVFTDSTGKIEWKTEEAQTVVIDIMGYMV